MFKNISLKIWVTAACITFLGLSIGPVAAAEQNTAGEGIVLTKADARVVINGNDMAGAALTASGRLMVPLRPLFEAMGGDVYWDSSSRSVRVFHQGGSITVQVGDLTAWQGSKQVSLDVPPAILNDRLYIPLRFAVESLGGQIDWNGEERTASITLDGQVDARALNPEPPTVISYTPEELDLLVRVINAEAYDEPYLGKVAVGAVIINRAKGDYFSAGTIKDVILSGCQFSVVCNGRISTLSIQEDSRQAALEALRGNDPTNGAIFFANLRIASHQAFWRSLTQVAVIGRHTFFKK